MTAATNASQAQSSALPVLELQRVFQAPRTLVWQAWTEAAHLAHWWGPQGFTNPVCEIDLRPGGAIRIDMRWPQGEIIQMGGTVHEIDPPRRLVFTSTAGVGTDGLPLLEVRNTVLLTEQGAQTLLALRAEVVKAAPEMAQALAGMEEGWSQSLDKLAAHLPLAADGYGFALTLPVPLEIHITRRFSAPPELVYAACTTAQHLQRWWGPRGMEMTRCEVDLRVGGGYRFVLRSPDGQEVGFNGEYRELVPGRRIVQTFVYEPIPQAWSVETLELTPIDGGTLVTGRIVHLTQEYRDGQVGAGMEAGLRESWERLEELLVLLA